MTRGADTLVEALAAMAVEGRDHGVPSEVEESAALRVLDIVGICVAACSLPTSEAVHRFVASQGGHPQATAIGMADRWPAPLAALVNGTLAHSLDYDDTHLPSVLHPSASVVPACLAAAEMVGASGVDLLRAVAVGLEVCVRLGMAGYDRAARNSTYFDRGQHATSICGAIGGAAATAVLLGLDRRQVADAMAISVSMAGGVIEANRTGGTVKRIHCGWAAHGALCAALLAAEGVTGPLTVLEGRFGFFRAYLDGHYEAGAVIEGLGVEWAVPGINFKPYPANHFCHAGIDAAMALRQRGVRPEDIASMTLGVAAPVLRTIGEPLDLKRRPESGYQAQFSGPYTVVAALLGGSGLGVGLDDFTDALAREPLRRRLMDLVDVVEDAECSELFPNHFPAVLRAELLGGERVTERVMTNRGSLDRPLTREEVQVKFADNAGRALDGAKVTELGEILSALGTSATARSCLAPLAVGLGGRLGDEVVRGG